MGQEKMLAIMGNSGSGKTTVSIKLACALATKKKNVIVVFCDPFTPVIPALLPPSVIHDISLGALLTEPGLTQTNILNACVPSPSNEYISLLGYRMGENLLNYPKITRDKAVELFVSLRYLADYVIFDCSTIFEADKHRIAVHYMELGEHRLVVADAFWVSAAYNAHNAVGKLHGAFGGNVEVADSIHHGLRGNQSYAVEHCLGKFYVGYFDNSFFADFFAVEVVAYGHICVHACDAKKFDGLEQSRRRDTVYNGAVAECCYGEFFFVGSHSVTFRGRCLMRVL